MMGKHREHMDHLRRRVESNRQDFEIYELGSVEIESTWETIKDATGEKYGNPEKNRDPAIVIRITTRAVLRFAASLAAIIIIGSGVLWVAGNAKQSANGVSLRDLSPELAETELYYNQLVQEKILLIQTGNQNVDLKVLANLQMLDSAYQDLKNDLQDNMDNEEVVDAMIQNYRIRLQILEQVLEDLREKSKGDTSSDEFSI